MQKEVYGRERIEGMQNLRCIADMHDAEHGESDEPHRHDRREPGRHAMRAAFLHHKKREQDHDRNQNDIGLTKGGVTSFSPSTAARTRWPGDDSIARKKRRADKTRISTAVARPPST